MNDKTMWMVRAGQHAHLYNEFKEKGIVAIGWNDVGDLSQITNPDQIKNVVRKTYSDYKPAKKSITAGQLIRFKFNFKLGDYVITYNPEDREYLIGEIISDYMYDPWRGGDGACIRVFVRIHNLLNIRRLHHANKFL